MLFVYVNNVFTFASIFESKSKRNSYKSKLINTMEIQSINNQTITFLRGNRKAKMLVCAEAGVSESTINRWLNEDTITAHEKLTRPNVLKVIARETGLTKKEILA